MDIQEAIIHVIDKIAGVRAVNLLPRATSVAPVDTLMNKLGSDILSIYSTNPINYGSFDTDHNTYPFPRYLGSYLDPEGQDLVAFSTLTLDLLASKIIESTPASGGYVLFLRYRSQGRDWLLIVMLKLKKGTGIDTNTLVLNDSMSFDVNHLHEAARIDLAKFQANDEPYLSFIKKSGRADDVTQYFRSAIGCTVYTESKFNTVQLLKSVDSYCIERGLEADRKIEVRRAVFDYCESKRALNEPVNLTALSAFIDDQDPTDFGLFVRQSDFEVSESFEAHKASYVKYKRIQGKVGNIRLSFDVEDLINGDVDYDEANGSLIIHNIPRTMSTQIQKARGDDEPTN